MLLYALTILVSAFLLFQVQPVIAKIILPWFGGSAAVWTTCLLFFQMVLLLGLPVRPRRGPLPQAARADAGALRAAAGQRGGAADLSGRLAGSPPGGEDPTLAILRLLAVTVGLPYFLLSTTGPLLQAWYARRFKGAMPYRLYALSNAGSMFALLSYPLLFEPVFTTHQQSWMWSIAYGVFIAAVRVHGLPLGAERVRRAVRGGRSRRRRTARRAASMPCGCAAGLRLGAAAGHHQPPVAERGGHSVPVGAAAEHLPAELYPVLRRQRLVPAQSLSAAAGGGAGQHGLRQQRGCHRQRAHQGAGAAVLAWACSPAAWCATENWRASSRIPGT